MVTSAHDAWVTVSSISSNSSGGSGSEEEEEEEEKGKKNKVKKRRPHFKATLLEMRELLRTERARGKSDAESGKEETMFRSVWRGWTRERELVASRVPASAPEAWRHWRFRDEEE